MRQQAVQSSISQAVKAAKVLQQIRAKQFDPIPEGWFTRADYEIENKCNRGTAMKELMELASAGAVELDSWPVQASDGRAIKTTIYKLK